MNQMIIKDITKQQWGVWWSLQEANPKMDRGKWPKCDLVCMQMMQMICGILELKIRVWHKRHMTVVLKP